MRLLHSAIIILCSVTLYLALFAYQWKVKAGFAHTFHIITNIHNDSNRTSLPPPTSTIIKCGYLMVGLEGRLGNQMGQIAALIGLSLATNREAVMPETAKYLMNTFPNLYQYIFFNSSFVANRTWHAIIPKFHCCHYDETVKQRIQCGTDYRNNSNRSDSRKVIQKKQSEAKRALHCVFVFSNMVYVHVLKSEKS